MAKVFRITPTRIKRTNSTVLTPDMAITETTLQHTLDLFYNGTKAIKEAFMHLFIERIYSILLAFIVLFCLSSCDNDKRMVKKFIYRMNAREVSAASKYIYPSDHPGLYLFNSEVFAKSPNTFFKIKEQRKSLIDGKQSVIVQLECMNVSPFFRDYMMNLGMLRTNDIIVDTIQIRETESRKCLSFGWTTIQGENLKLAAISDTIIDHLNIHSGEGIRYPVIGILYNGKKIIIDEYSDNREWVKCYMIDQKCNIKQGYIDRLLLKTEGTMFFTLSIFESLSVIVALIVFIILGVPLFFLRSIISAFKKIPFIGILICVGLVLGLLYAIYQLLENILFELFLINLPG